MLTNHRGKTLWKEKSKPHYKLDLEGLNGNVYSKVLLFNDDIIGSKAVVKNKQLEFWDVHIIDLDYVMGNLFDYFLRLDDESSYLIFERFAETVVNNPAMYYEPFKKTGNQ